MARQRVTLVSGLSAIVLTALGCGRVGFDAAGDEGPFEISAVDASARDGSTDQPTDGNGLAADGTVLPVDASTNRCSASGQVITPIQMLNASPVDLTTACNVENADALDGEVTGLDLHGSTSVGCASLDARIPEVCGCVAADFGAELEVDQLQLRVGAAPDACGSPCTDGDCGTGHVAAVLAGPGIDSDFVVAEALRLTFGRALTDYFVDVQQTVRYVLVCREAWSDSRDDVVVDSIAATCR